MVKEDNYGASDYDDAAAHLALAQHCCFLAYEQWVTTLLVQGQTPEAASTTLNNYVSALFANGTCTPPSMRRKL